jgi:hypothetical protein
MKKQLIVQPNTIVRIICRIGVSRSRVDSDPQQTVDRGCARIVASSEQPGADALKDGDAVGSRVRIAAAACLVASGLLAGGASASVALADPVSSDDAGDKHTNDSVGNGSVEGQKSDPDEKKTPPGADGKGAQSGTDSVHHPKAGSGNKDGENGHGDNGHGNGDNGHGDNGNNGHGNNGHGNGDNGNGDNGNNGHGNGDNGNNGHGNGHGGNGHGGNGHGGNGHGGNGHGDNGNGNNGNGNGNNGNGGCEDENDCSPGWPWWPVPVGQPPGPGGGGGGGGGHPEVPSGHPRVPPRMQLPPELMPPATEPVGPSVIDVAPGVGIAAAEFPTPPIMLPVIVAPATGLGGGGGSPGSPALPAVPRGVTAKPPAGREPLPANVGSNVAVPASSYRIGYTDYLRYAGLSQVAALAVPGVAGMLVLTGAGGLVGYRQAKAGHAVHTSGTARFVN